MAHVITQQCCNDASCIPECPVDCIRPTPDQPEFARAEMLYIDPASCIDCGACVDVCPVDAISPDEDLVGLPARFTDINAAYFRRYPLQADVTSPLPAAQRLPKGHPPLRVAIVGSGPAGCYAAAELLARADVEITMLEKLPTPWGLVRAGVAPDHPDTRSVTDTFAQTLAALRCYLNTSVGEHISVAELLEHHHAVIVAVGAAADRRLGVPGEDLPGCHSTTEFVGWYNGHPGYSEHSFDLSGERAVLVGNGNVALDVARMLAAEPRDLARTDMADYAISALQDSKIREVVVLGRRGPVQAAYTGPEFLGLAYLPGADVLINECELMLDPHSQALADDPAADPSLQLKLKLAQQYSRTAPLPILGRKHIRLRYLVAPVAVHGTDRVESLELAHTEIVSRDGELVARTTDRTETIATSLVLRSIGSRGVPLPGLPFDERRGLIPNERGRVLSAEQRPMPGVYVTGWIKRGPVGVIGTNRTCAQETVDQLLADFADGSLANPSRSRESLTELLAERQPDAIDHAAWQAIDAAERAAGRRHGRPRVKLTSTDALLQVARSATEAEPDRSRSAAERALA
ncbi:FAD-dependent oxidoreductase [Nocardia sp. NPDC060256]|uniref:FAD-dependent oxidoreductase n=1 Tax=unclassified Nocardia TaxID=2637762 RepID=UPI00364B0BF4